MIDEFVLETLEEYFGTEVSNEVEKKEDGLVVKLADGTKAKIKPICLS